MDRDKLLEILRWRIEHPSEKSTEEDERLWGEFLKSEDYEKFIITDYKKLKSFITDFLVGVSLKLTTKETILDMSKIILGVSNGYDLVERYQLLIKIYKDQWLPKRKNRLDRLMSNFEMTIGQYNNLPDTKEIIISLQEVHQDLPGELVKEESFTELQTEEQVEAQIEEQVEENETQINEEPHEELVIKWNHLSIENGPDMHEESFHKWDKSAYAPITLIGARVRGKKHKHEGTNCDDWFTMESVGKWNVIAVSDGAGSKKFSRVGARASTEAAIEFLKEKLENFMLDIKGEGNDFARDPETFQFLNQDLAFIEENLHTAFFKAYQAVELAVKERMEGEEASVYRDILQRDLEVNDLSCTLLLAVQTMVNGKSFILACQIGDGATVAITENPEHPVFVLGISDGGQYSGETDFLTSRKFEKKNYLLSRTYPCYGAIKALLVMSDGVADDYFPSNERMNYLYEDLCREKIIVKVEDEDYEAQAERLENWIDSYQVRGSFDDRTLVVLYKGDQE